MSLRLRALKRVKRYRLRHPLADAKYILVLRYTPADLRALAAMANVGWPHSCVLDRLSILLSLAAKQYRDSRELDIEDDEGNPHSLSDALKFDAERDPASGITSDHIKAAWEGIDWDGASLCDDGRFEAWVFAVIDAFRWLTRQRPAVNRSGPFVRFAQLAALPLGLSKRSETAIAVEIEKLIPLYFQQSRIRRAGS